MRWFRAVTVAALVALTGVAALAVATGAVGAVVTYGISMEPGFHTGDLAVFRASGEYTVGEVVAYRSADLKQVVMHRIVSVQDGRYTFKGDNNSWIDPETPVAADVLGELWFSVPQGGVWLDRLTSPLFLGGLVFALLAFGGATIQTRRSRRRRRHSMSEGRSPARRGPMHPAMRTAAAVTAALVVAGIVAVAVTWAGPSDEQVTVEEQAARQMVFSYSADVPLSPAYQGTVATSPDVVFRTLANTVDVQYAYQGPPGTVSVTADLSTANGWHRVLTLAPETTFAQDEYTGSVRLDLDEIYALTQAAANVTEPGFEPAPVPSVSIALIPTVRTAVGNFAPQLHLSLTASSLALGRV